MSQNLFIDFPIPVTLALVALVLVLACVARVLASLVRPAPLLMPPDAVEHGQQHLPADLLEHELRTH